MAAITITDLDNAKIDVDHIAEIANSVAIEATDRLGHVKDTISGAVYKITAFNNRGAWAALIAYAVKDLVSNGGVWYVAVVAHTSSAAFATDTASKWRIYQGVTTGDLSASSGANIVGFLQAGTGAVARTLQDKARDFVTPEDFGAVGDGVTNDGPSMQLALNYIMQGGRLELTGGKTYLCNYAGALGGTGNALVMEVQAYTGSYPASYTNKPISIVGNGATLQMGATGENAVLLNIVNAQDVEISGVKFVGPITYSVTAYPNYTTGKNLFINYCKNVKVTGCTFTNLAVYYIANNFIFSGNNLLGTYQGIQGTYSTSVNIEGNNFKCSLLCDDQIAIFGASTKTSKDILIIGNTVDKGYDGTKGVGGTVRTFASFCTIGEYLSNVTVSNNIVSNINSQNVIDRSGWSCTAIRQEGYTSVNNILITGNTIRNCRYGIHTVAKSGVIVSGNTFTDIENSSIVSDGYSSGSISVIENSFRNCGSVAATDVGIDIVDGFSNAVIDKNRFDGCTFFATIRAGSYAAFVAGTLSIRNNYEVNATDVSGTAGTSFISLNWVDISFICDNKAIKKCKDSIISSARGNFQEVSGNVLIGAALYSVFSDYVEAGKSGLFISTGNYCMPDTASSGGRDNLLKFPLGDAALLASGYHRQYSLANTVGQGQFFGNTDEATTAAGTAFKVGDKVYYDSVTGSGGYVGKVCTVAGSPGTWKEFGLIA